MQLVGIVTVAGIGLTVFAAMSGLALGALPRRLAPLGRVADSDAIPLALAAGFFGAAISAGAALARTPEWARFPPVDSLGTAWPMLEVALGPLGGVLTSVAIVLTAVVTIDRITASWTRRRGAGIFAVAAMGFLAGGVPIGADTGGWLLGGAIMAIGVTALYVTLLRFDPTLIPITLGTMAAVRAISNGMQRPFPGALIGAVAAAGLVLALSWWWFRLLRRNS